LKHQKPNIASGYDALSRDAYTHGCLVLVHFPSHNYLLVFSTTDDDDDDEGADIDIGSEDSDIDQDDEESAGEAAPDQDDDDGKKGNV
jgi:hypothetical protein